ncbi:unnamed protein product [Lathyrus sativus]|nr:unnamed protein product [Lathyrus sativus]
MMRMAAEKGKFNGFNVGEGFQVELIQFVDDTLINGEGSWYNLWSTQVVLRGFELVSGMKVNFIKSRIIGVNVSPYFLLAVATFLSCRVDKTSFTLELPLGLTQEEFLDGNQFLTRSRRNWLCGRLEY